MERWVVFDLCDEITMTGLDILLQNAEAGIWIGDWKETAEMYLNIKAKHLLKAKIEYERSERDFIKAKKTFSELMSLAGK